jgi:hypothetical protein
MPPEAMDFAGRLRKYSRVVLVALQPLPEPVTPLLLEAMRRAPPDWIWLLRKHPLGKIPDLEAQLRAAGVREFETDLCSRLPLFAVLALCSHHVTRHSSVCRESVAQGVPTGIVHRIGHETYHEEIAEGLMRRIETPEELLAFVAESPGVSQAGQDGIICADPGVARRAVHRILEMTSPQPAGPRLPSAEVEQLLAQGEQLRRAGSLEQAIGKFGEAFRLAPGDGVVAVALAGALDSGGHTALAERVRRTVKQEVGDGLAGFEAKEASQRSAAREKTAFPGAKAKLPSPDSLQSHFLQMRTLAELPGVRRILEIGSEDAFVARNLRAMAREVHTLAVDTAQAPTFVGELRDFDPVPLAGFYDAVCAFQVLEFMPYAFLPVNLLKMCVLSRRWVLIGLTYDCRGQIRIQEDWEGRKRIQREEQAAFTGTGLPNLPNPENLGLPRWEIGKEGFSLERIREDIRDLGLRITREFHAPAPFHYFLLLEKS